MPQLSVVSNNMTPASPSIAWLNNLSDVIERLREVYPDMTLNQVSVLLNVASHPGITQRQIMENTGLADSSASRIVAILSEHGNRGTGPFHLIELHEGTEDRRIKELHLSKKGKDLVRDLTKAIARGK